MAKYRKRPIVVEAHQWMRNGDHPLDDVHPITSDEGTCFMSEGKIVRYYRTPAGFDSHRTCDMCTSKMYEHGWIDTLEGGMIVCPGDFIVTGVVNEMYPCKPDVFLLTYEEVKE